MDKAEAVMALIPNVRLNLLTCDITNYKETQVINKMRKLQIKTYLQPLL